MKLKEMKVKTFSLIEEYYPESNGMAEDEDVLNKINGVINQIQLDLMKYRKITANETIEIMDDSEKTISIKDYISDLYQINTIRSNPEVEIDTPDEDTIILPDDYEGTLTIYYYKYPKLVKTVFVNDTEKDEEDEKYKFELDTVLLEIMPYGVAADLLKMDMISNYGKYFYERYLEMKNSIDPRRSAGEIKFTGGVDI